MAAPNIVNVATITGATAVQSVATSATAIVTNSSGSNSVYKVESLILANVNGSASATVQVGLVRSSTTYYIAYNVTVPAGSTFVPIDKSVSIYLQEGDSLTLLASSSSYIQAVCSYEAIS